QPIHTASFHITGGLRTWNATILLTALAILIVRSPPGLEREPPTNSGGIILHVLVCGPNSNYLALRIAIRGAAQLHIPAM
ncbi:MAG: hypothetical protein ACT4P5_20660, partial [Armatimonadota bacterium]